MEKNKPNLSQEYRILEVLENNRGTWINGQKFCREMMITQFHRAIHNLEKRDKIEVEHSDFKDNYGFLSYRLPLKTTLF